MAAVREKAVRGEARTKEDDELLDEVKDIWNWTVEWQHFKDTMLCSGADEYDKVHGTTDRSSQLLRHLVGGAGNMLAGREHMVPETMCCNVDFFAARGSIGALGKKLAQSRLFVNPEDDFVWWVTEKHVASRCGGGRHVGGGPCR